MKAQSVLDTIGRTPHIRVARLFPDAEVWINSDRANSGGSVKDRIALAMIEAARMTVASWADALPTLISAALAAMLLRAAHKAALPASDEDEPEDVALWLEPVLWI